MKIFYKYTSYIDEDTFKDPSIRLSCPIYLNDPFESDICESFREANKHNYKTQYGDIYPKGLINSHVSSQMEKYGVVSLSETSRNLLMWAHYANEHRGICIGYYEDFLDSQIKPSNNDLSGHFLPVKVNYDTLRYYIDGDQESELSKTDSIFKMLTRKSDEWIYEKEYRCIVPLMWADYVKYKKSLSEIDEYLIGKLKASIDRTDIDNDKYKPSELAAINLGFGISLADYFMPEKSAAFIKRIQSNKIAKIYFGCRFSNENLQSILAEVSDPSHKLHNVKMYKYELHEDRFELKENLVYPQNNRTL